MCSLFLCKRGERMTFETLSEKQKTLLRRCYAEDSPYSFIISDRAVRSGKTSEGSCRLFCGRCAFLTARISLSAERPYAQRKKHYRSASGKRRYSCLLRYDILPVAGFLPVLGLSVHSRSKDRQSRKGRKREKHTGSGRYDV